MNRKGLLIIQDFVAWGILIVLGVLFLFLFLGLSRAAGDTYTGSNAEIVEVSFSAGGDLLRSYLSTPMDLPVEKYLPADVSAVVDPLDGTFADGIAWVFANESCRKAIATEHPYPDVKEHPYEAIFAVPFADPTCAAFFERSALFFRAVADEDRYVLQVRKGGEVFRIGANLHPYVGPPYDGWFLWEPEEVNAKADQLIKPIGEMLLRVPRNVYFGTQHLPDGIEVKLILVEREVPDE